MDTILFPQSATREQIMLYEALLYHLHKCVFLGLMDLSLQIKMHTAGVLHIV